MSRSIRILIVDDEPSHVGFIVDRLMSHDYVQVELISSVREFDSLSMDELKEFDLILLDLSIATLDCTTEDGFVSNGRFAGIYIAERIRIDYGIGERVLPIVGYTGNLSTAISNQLKSLEVKPIDKSSPQKFIRQVERSVEQILIQKEGQ